MRTISAFRSISVFVLTIAAISLAVPAAAIEVKIDYSYDTKGFFPAGSQARIAMEAAASFYSTILEDTFAAIEVPEKFLGSRGGEATWFWKRRFTNPETGFTEAKVNPSKIDENKFIVYVGARDLPTSGELGIAGPGSFVAGKAERNGEFTAAEKAEIDAIEATFKDVTTDRGETSGFGGWGGSIAFDSPTAWHFDHTTAPSGGKHDFYSTALHELAHVLGFGISDNSATNNTPWETLVSTNETSSSFTGSNANAAYTPAANVPLESKEKTAHWGKAVNGTVETDITSPVFQGSGMQIPLMYPSIPTNTRRLLTDLDAAALVDIGWEIDLPAKSASSTSSVNLGGASSGAVTVAALSLSIAPEPASGLLLAVAALSLLAVGRRRQA